MGVQGPVISVKIIAPDLTNQFFSGQGDVGISDHIEEQFIFLWGKLDPLAVDFHDSGGEIHRKSPQTEEIGGGFGTFLHSFQNGGNPEHQFLGRKGLDHIIVCPDLKAVDPVVFLSPGGQQNDGQIRMQLFDLSAGGKSVQFGHHNV